MFGFVDRQMTPTPMMAASLLYKLHGHGQKTGVSVDSTRFREARAPSLSSEIFSSLFFSVSLRAPSRGVTVL